MSSVDVWVERIVAAMPALPEERRTIVAIGGPPAAGKSTLAEGLEAHWGAACGVLPLDGFHFDDRVLEERGDRARKGAPHTFDVHGFAALLAAVRSQPDVEIGVPRFDRSLELSRAAAAVLGPRQRIVVVEGNYLHAAVEPWSSLSPLFDVAVAIDVPEDVLEQRILDRWRRHGCTESEAQARWERNDRPNAAWEVAHRRAVPVVLGGDAAA